MTSISIRFWCVFFPLVAGQLCAGLGSSGNAEEPAGESEILFREDFANLENWRSWEFDGVDRPADYAIRKQPGSPVLRMESNGGGSGLISLRDFSTSEDLRLRWRWRADVLPDVSDTRQRDGDDYAVRIYVVFQKDASDAGWLERWALRDAPFRDEGVLPERSVVYAWTDRKDLPEHFPNPYTDRAVMFPVRMDESDTGEWREVEAEPVADYRKAFGEDPPSEFRLAVMSDSDDTDTRSVAWLDFIEITAE